MSWGIWQQLKHWSDVVWDDLMPWKTSKHSDNNIPLNRWDAIISRHNRRLTSVVRESDLQSWTCAWGVRRNIHIKEILVIISPFSWRWMECYYVRHYLPSYLPVPIDCLCIWIMWECIVSCLYHFMNLLILIMAFVRRAEADKLSLIHTFYCHCITNLF